MGARVWRFVRQAAVGRGRQERLVDGAGIGGSSGKRPEEVRAGAGGGREPQQNGQAQLPTQS